MRKTHAVVGAGLVAAGLVAPVPEVTDIAGASFGQCPGANSGYFCAWSSQNYAGNFGKFFYSNPTTWSSIAPGLYNNDESWKNGSNAGNEACTVRNYGTGFYQYGVRLGPGETHATPQIGDAYNWAHGNLFTPSC